MHVRSNVNINTEITPVENEVEKRFEVVRCCLLNVSFNAYLNIKEVGNLESDATNNIFEKTFPKTYT